MLSLLIDTSTERAYGAFFESTNLLFQGELPFGLHSSQHLLPELHRGLDLIGRKTHDLDYIAVGIGPGSYTGIRVGVMVAKTIAFAQKIPLITFCSLEAFSPSKEGPFAVILDAKIGGVYLLKGKFQKKVTEFEKTPQLIPLKELDNYLDQEEMLVTPNASLIKKKLEEIYPQNHWIWEENEPNLLNINRLVEKKWRDKIFTDDRHLELLYLRKTQAEIEKDMQKRIQY